MKKSVKNNIGFTIVIASIAVVIGLIWIGITSLVPPDKDKLEKYFWRDKDDMSLVVEYFINSEYLSIYIDKSNQKEGTMFTGARVGTRNTEIEDKNVKKAIDQLFRRGYSVIGRYGNTIRFQKWSFGGENHGIAYSINGEDKPMLDYLVNLELLLEPNWYYYESDYEEWRS